MTGDLRPLAVVIALASSASASARAQDLPDAVEACASASEEAQALRNQYKLRAAREKLLACTQPACPAVILRDCDALLSEVEAAVPTVILTVRDAQGRDVTAVRVLLDGSPLASALDGHAMALDPGPHTLRFERAGGLVDQLQLVAREGEKDRVLAVQLAPDPARGPVTPLPPPERDDGDTPWPAYALGGAGALALGAFGVLVITGQSEYDECESAGCSTNDVDALERQRWMAWTALGVGVVAVGAAVLVLIASD